MPSELDIEIVNDFQTESRGLIKEMMVTLETCEGDYSQVLRLENYGQIVDRIMGGAFSLVAQMETPNLLMKQVGDYAAICKAVGYKASQINDNEEFYDVCVAFLLDATEVLRDLVDAISGQPSAELKDFVTKTFIERLKWLSERFGQGYRASVGVSKKTKDSKMSQNQIDDLMKKLGIS